MSAPAVGAHPLIHVGSNAHALGNRFLLAAVAFLRSKQIKDGAVARVERGGHKPTFVAILEVLADRISWSHGPEVVDEVAQGGPGTRNIAGQNLR